jgi:hypothetical protein
MNFQCGFLPYLTVVNGVGDKVDSTEDQQLLSCHYIQCNIRDRDFDSNKVRDGVVTVIDNPLFPSS